MNHFYEKREKMFQKTAIISLKKIMSFFADVVLRFSWSVEGIVCSARPTEEEIRLL